MRSHTALSLVLVALALTELGTKEPAAPKTKVPRWDARGVGQSAWQGVARLDANDDVTRIALGTIAPTGDPNGLLLDSDGKSRGRAVRVLLHMHVTAMPSPNATKDHRCHPPIPV